MNSRQFILQTIQYGILAHMNIKVCKEWTRHRPGLYAKQFRKFTAAASPNYVDEIWILTELDHTSMSSFQQCGTMVYWEERTTEQNKGRF